MRSHLVSLPLPPKTPQKQETDQQLGVDDSTQSITSSDCSLSETKGSSVYGLRENPKKSFRMVDPDQFLEGVVQVQDTESETESNRKPTRKRSKRTRRMLVAKPEDAVIKKEKTMKPSSSGSLVELEPVSSISDISVEEDLALCLIMLSRDVWRTSISDDSEEYSKLLSRTHKKIKIIDFCEENGESGELFTRNAVISSSIKDVVDKKVHECPFCSKVFGSGQALGGHKRSHFLCSSTTTTLRTTTSSASKSVKVVAAESNLVEESSNSAKFRQGMLMIDLNLPASMEENEDFKMLI